MPRYRATTGQFDGNAEWQIGPFDTAGFDAADLRAAKAIADERIETHTTTGFNEADSYRVWSLTGNEAAYRELSSSQWIDA